MSVAACWEEGMTAGWRFGYRGGARIPPVPAVDFGGVFVGDDACIRKGWF